MKKRFYVVFLLSARIILIFTRVVYARAGEGKNSENESRPKEKRQ